MKNNLLTLVLPTVNPDQMFKLFIPSLDNLVEAKDYVKISINYQSPWTSDTITKSNSLIESKGFTCHSSFNTYDTTKGVPINRIRNDSVVKCNDIDSRYYMLIDDDMQFQGATPLIKYTAGEQILQSLDYLLTNPECGVMKMGGSMVKYPPKYHIGVINHIGDIVTNKGAIFINLKLTDKYSSNKSPLFPDDSLGLLGSDEEKLLAASRYYSGLYVSRQGFFHIRHYENRHSKIVNVTSGQELYHWVDLRETNNWKYIKDHFILEDDIKGKKSDLAKTGKFISDSLYTGIDPSERTLEYPYTIDYTDCDTHDLIKLIDHKLLDLL